MKRSKFTEAQIAFALKQSETGTRVDEICRKMGISQATFFNWKKKYSGLGVSELRRLRQLEEENNQLKKLVADLSLDKQMLQDVIKKAMKPVFRKQAAVWLQDQYRISGRRACRMVSLSSSMYYYRHQPREDAHLRLRIRDIALSRVRYGFWRIFVLLRREGFTDNHKRVYRVYKEEGLNLRSKRPCRSRGAAHRLERLETPAINQVWSMDFVQDALFNGSRFRILAVVDNYSKKCLSLLVGKSLKGEDVRQDWIIFPFVREWCPNGSSAIMAVNLFLKKLIVGPMKKR